MTATACRLSVRLRLHWAERALTWPCTKAADIALDRTALAWEALNHGRS